MRRRTGWSRTRVQRRRIGAETVPPLPCTAASGHAPRRGAPLRSLTPRESPFYNAGARARRPPQERGGTEAPMTKATRRRAQRLAPGFLLAAATLTWAARPARGLTLDDRGEMRLGLRAYTAARIGTEKMGGSDDPLGFPNSAAGHLRQHRYFLELKLDHDVRRLAKTGYGLARLFDWIDPNTLKYSLQYRGEGEGIYDYGPDEFHHQFRKLQAVRLDIPNIPGLLSNRIPDAYIKRRIDFLRRIARQRHRFFLGYVDFEKGPVFLRVGRQILAWGETDVFRLLDNINPLDDSFGGFFIALDERRLPLDMARASYHFGSVGPLHDAFLEGFAAFGNRVATVPGIPPGSPWEPGGLGFPLPNLRMVPTVPDRREGRGSSADSTGTPGSAAARRLQQENNTEGGLDPFVYPGFLDLTRKGPVQGKVLQRDTFNFAAGLDLNRFVRWVNPSQTIFITTQFFYKHVFDSPGDLVLPVSSRLIAVDKSILIIGTGCGPKSARRACRLEPRLFHLDDDRFLHTLQVTTSYYGGRIVPSYGMFYDWQGAFVFQPGAAYVRDPFRFIIDYTRIEAAPTGQFGAVRDRDNVRFQVEYVF